MDEQKTFQEHLNEIVDLYPQLDGMSSPHIFTLYDAICNEQVLSEFEVKTIEIDKTIKTLKSKFDVDKIETIESSQYTKKPRHSGNEFIFVTFNKDQFKIIQKINRFMNTFGWQPTAINNINYTSKILKIKMQYPENIEIQYIAKYDIDIKKNYPAILYHLTPDVSLDSIKYKGLTPKSKSRLSAHPERIYLMTTSNFNIHKRMAETLWNSYERIKDITEYYYVLKIDATNLTNHKFYKDPNFDHGIWTHQNIPAKYIEKGAKILVNLNYIQPPWLTK